MQIVADLHLHSRYSRAVSQDMILPTMARMAQLKGIDLLTASDWTHPLWFKEIQMQLEEVGEGVYGLKQRAKGLEQRGEVRFILTTEIASIFKQHGKLRRIHNLVFAPNFSVANEISNALRKRGCNLSSDGRPIIGLSSKELLELILSIDERSFLIPCHVWTPHFGMYGSASGFDAIEESFGELGEYIYGIETGLSSDPDMNWQIPELATRSILSFSDAHSPLKMGREATIFVSKNGELGMKNYELRYEDIRLAIQRRSPKLRVGYTVEFYPEEGKYHFSGHRNCGVRFGPDEIKEKGNICPKCQRRLTEGVLYRVQSLAGESFQLNANEKLNEYKLKWFTDPRGSHPPYVKLVPLLEIVAESMESTVGSMKVKEMYYRMCQNLASEMDILLKTPLDEVRSFAGERVAEGVQKVREGSIFIDPGYDNVYGVVKIWHDESTGSAPTEEEQMALL
jgi:uncharacterized protein (TIGR00375 family)